MVNRKKLVAVFIAGVVVGGSTLAGLAALPAGQMAIQAVLNMDKKISYQGQYFKDSKGVNMNSISYNGVEYLPLNVFEKAGVAVNKGEGKDKNIYIGSSSKEIMLNASKFINEKNKEFLNYTTAKQELFVDGKIYKYGYTTNQTARKSVYDKFEYNGGCDIILSLSTSKTNVIPSSFKGSFFINEDAIINSYPSYKDVERDITKELKLIVLSTDKDGEQIIASEPITPGKILNLEIPYSGSDISFRIGTTGVTSECKYENLNLMILEPRLVK